MVYDVTDEDAMERVGGTGQWKENLTKKIPAIGLLVKFLYHEEGPSRAFDLVTVWILFAIVKLVVLI